MQLEIGFSARVDILCNILSLRLLACRANGLRSTGQREDREKYSKRRVFGGVMVDDEKERKEKRKERK